ncbi:MAG TPA: DUF2252 family protein [Tepidisphaeraceae bacterium]|jgi:uncharacterized protein (DUF2252 family)
MMRQALILALALLFGFTTGASAQQQRAYEATRRSFAPYLGERDPFAWPVRAYYMSQSPLQFFVGAQDSFFLWCRSNTTDWTRDEAAVVPCHGNATPAALSTYACTGAFGKVAFGITAFDDSSRIPFQVELLQSFIMLRLIADQNRIEMTNASSSDLLDIFCDAYRQGLSSQRDATALFATDPWVGKLLSGDASYDDLLSRYTSVGQFKRVITSADGKPIEVLRPAIEAADQIAAVIADATRTSPDFAKLMRYSSREDFRAAIRDVAARTVIVNPTTPGVRQYLVLLTRPLVDLDHDLILSLRKQFPSSAERAAAAPRDPRAPAERATQDAKAAMDPGFFLSAYGRSGGDDSYCIRLLDPWSSTLAEQPIQNTNDLTHLAQIWGAVTGLTHRQIAEDNQLGKLLTPDLRKLLLSRADAYLKQLRADFDRMMSDPIANADVAAAKEAIANATQR